jgi:hypothetical protein
MRSTAFLLTLIFFLPILSLGKEMDEEEIRLRGFGEHQREQMLFEKERAASLNEHNEEYEKWERGRIKGIAEYKKEVPLKAPVTGGPEHMADIQEKNKFNGVYEKETKLYVSLKRSFDRKSARHLVTEEVELDLYNLRPRYEYKKRCSYGSNGKWCHSGGSSASSGGGSSGSSGGTYFPPPPSFDDFAGDSGYIPPPSMNGEESDFPPPPPPPMFEGGGDFPGGEPTFGGGINGGDFVPPPPSDIPQY